MVWPFPLHTFWRIYSGPRFALSNPCTIFAHLECTQLYTAGKSALMRVLGLLGSVAHPATPRGLLLIRVVEVVVEAVVVPCLSRPPGMPVCRTASESAPCPTHQPLRPAAGRLLPIIWRRRYSYDANTSESYGPDAMGLFSW